MNETKNGRRFIGFAENAAPNSMRAELERELAGKAEVINELRARLVASEEVSRARREGLLQN